MRESWRSSKSSPCPVCGRDKDGDCSIKDYGNVVYCHTHQSEIELDGWKFIKTANGGAGWGMFVKRELDNPFKRDDASQITYNYDDRNGNRLIQVVRQKGDSRFPFYQTYWDGEKFTGKKNFPSNQIDEAKKRVPIYNYSRVQEAIAEGKAILVVEGEKCADALNKLGFTATTSIGGSNAFNRWGDYSQDLLGAALLAILPDLDQKGWDYALKWQELYPSAIICKPFPDSALWSHLPDSGGLDVADWIEAGNDADAIKRLIKSTREALLKTPEQSETIKKFKGSLLEFSEEVDVFKKTLLENQIRSEYKVSGRRLERLLDSINSASDTGFKSMGDICVSLFIQIENQSKSTTIPGYFTQLTPLNTVTGGFQPGSLVILAARPSMGKTAIALSICHDIARCYPERVAIFSMEMSSEQLSYRLLSKISGLSAGVIKSGNLHGDQWTKIAESADHMSGLNLFIDDSGLLTLSAIRQKLTELAKVGNPISICCIDYLQLISGEMGDNRNAELSQITRGLKILARELNCCVLCLSQLSRAVESRNDKTPMLSDLRDSGAIEQDADQVIMLYRDDYYTKEKSERPDEIDILVTKNREGPIGKCTLMFDKFSTSFREKRTVHYG